MLNSAYDTDAGRIFFRCLSMSWLCLTQASGQVEGLGYAGGPSATSNGDESDAEDEGQGVASEAPPSYTPALARQ